MNEEREWVVYREITTRQVFTGITARTRDEAIEAWSCGMGEIQPDREQRLTNFDAVDVPANRKEHL